MLNFAAGNLKQVFLVWPLHSSPFNDAARIRLTTNCGAKQRSSLVEQQQRFLQQIGDQALQNLPFYS